MDSKAHKELLRRQFAAQAQLSRDLLDRRHAENIAPLLELARPAPADRLLDVACGWGFVNLEFSGRVKTALGIDLTPEMVELARTVAAERGVANVEYRVGDAEALDLPAGSFEIVTCRLTFHHFGEPGRALSEMKRVLAPGGRIVLYDFLAHADEGKAGRLNEIERLRDPCHVRIYSAREYHALFERAGLGERGRITTLMKRDFDSWMSSVEGDASRRREVFRALAETEEGNRAGLGVRVRGDRLTFTHTSRVWLLAPSA